MSTTPIRTLIVDDHPAMRAGIAAVLDQEEDIAVVGAATGGRQMWRALGPAEPDVVLMDYDLEGDDGVILCHPAQTPVDHIAEVTGMTAEHVEEAVERMLRRLVPARGTNP